MDISEVSENLCSYDKRNHLGLHDEEDEKPNPCYCDNCFYGKDKLANELLKYISAYGVLK